jgi:hypothetical protein
MQVNAQAKHMFVSRLQLEELNLKNIAAGKSPEVGADVDSEPVLVRLPQQLEEKNSTYSPRSISAISSDKKLPEKEIVQDKEKKHWSCCWPFSLCCGVSKKVAQAPKHHKQSTVIDYDPTQGVPGHVPMNRDW